MDRKLPRRRQIQKIFQRIEESTTSLTSVVSSSRPKLCELCQLLRFQPLREGEVYHHGLQSQIETSAKAGCPLCSLILENFDLEPPTIPVRLCGVRKKLSLQEKTSLVEEGDIEALGVANGYEWDLQNPFAHKLALYTTHDNAAAPYIKRRPFINDFAADTTYRLIKSWLDTCVFHHPGCNSTVISRLPTRVVDVGLPGSRQNPLLFTPPQGYKDSYIALSYCWGSADSRFVLTKDKAQLAKLEFPISTLPKTLQDAVTITRRLGFRFLWIDALCIIQEGDGGEDFLRESATMSDVYGNATLTIAAAAATTVHEGIFRQPSNDPQPEAKIPYDLPDGTIGTAFVKFEGVEEGGSRIHEPLNSRGWTFQERILSPRVIVFYKDELSWDCTSTLINSNGPLNSLLHLNQDSPGRYSDYIASRPLSDAIGDSDGTKYMSYWRTLVEFYSRRTLTNTNDKLKAIVGLAQQIKSKTRDSYVAGLWHSNLRAQLFWYTEERSAKRQSDYRAPTWSWASIDGHVRFRSDGALAFGKPNEDYDPEEVDLELYPKSDEFGEILRGRLTIRGHLLRADDVFSAESALKDLTWKELRHRDLYVDDLVNAYGLVSAGKSQLYFILHPWRRTSDPDMFVYALILKRHTNTTYQRVGIFRRQDRHKWYHSARGWSENETELVTIE